MSDPQTRNHCMDYADIYYLDPRNADHRTLNRVPVRPTGLVPATAAPAAIVAQPPSMLATYPPQYIIGGPPFGNGSFGNLGNFVNSVGGIGRIVDIAAQIIAAVLPLPTAPVPLGSDSNEGGPSERDTN